MYKLNRVIMYDVLYISMHTIHQTGTEKSMNNAPIEFWIGGISEIQKHLKNRYVLLFEKWTLHAQHIKVTSDKRLEVPFETHSTQWIFKSFIACPNLVKFLDV